MLFCIMARTLEHMRQAAHKCGAGQSTSLPRAAERWAAQGHGRTRVAFTRESRFSFISLEVFQSASNTPPVSCEPGLRVK